MNRLHMYGSLMFFIVSCGDDRHYPLGSSLNGTSHPHGDEEPVRETVQDVEDDGYEGSVNVPPFATSNGKLDVLAIVDTRFYPNATARDLEEKMVWLETLMQTYFGILVNMMSPPVFTSSEEGEGDLDFVSRVIRKHSLQYPEYIILFSYGSTGDGRVYGGYFTGRIHPALRYCNEFRSLDGNSFVPVGIVDLDHLFARCGYDHETTEHVSSTSSEGECRGVDGIPCVCTGDYFACEDRLGEPNIDQDRFTAWAAVHEFLHNWGSSHVCTVECEAEFGSCDAEGELAEEFNQSPCTIVQFQNSFASCE